MNNVPSNSKVSWLVLLGLTFFIQVNALAQDLVVTGKAIDLQNGEPLVGATVLFVNVKDSLASKFSQVDVNGDFTVKNLSRAFYKLQIRSLGYKPFEQIVRITESTNIPTIGLEPNYTELDEIVIQAEEAPVIKKGDTTVYRAGAYKTNPDASAADLVRKMPGIVVSENGVEANGEAIRQVLLDGKRFFGQDPLLALNTIPAEVVNQVEVFDQQSERSRMTGFDDGNTTRTMNVVTKEGKRQGEFGEVTAGMGTDGRYSVEGNVNSFKKERQLTILGMTNNVNKTDFTGSENSSGRRGGSRFFGGAQTPSGITETNTLGVNYSNEKKDKWRIESSYFYDQSELENRSSRLRETFLGETSQEYTEENRSLTDRANHRFNLRSEYQFDPNNSLVFVPSLTLQDRESFDFTEGTTFKNDEQINQTVNNYFTESQGFDYRSSLIYSHKFNSKRGRVFAIDMDFDLGESNGDNVFDDLQSDSSLVYENKSNTTSWEIEPSFIEPVGQNSQLQFSYEIGQDNRSREVMTYEYESGETNSRTFIESLSNDFTSIATYQRPSISFSKRTFANFFTARMAFQHTTLDNEHFIPATGTLTKNFNAVLPSIYGRIPMGEKMEVFFRYSTDADNPSADQLQEVIDNSDPLFLSVGNPELDQSYTHSLFARFGRNNVEKNTSLSNFIIVRNTADYISNSTFTAIQDTALTEEVTLRRGAQLTTPINLDGYWNVRNNTTYSFVLSKLKLNINANVGVAYIRNPGLINYQENVSQTYNLNSRLTIASNISKAVDFNVFYAWNTNQVENTIRRNSTYQTHSVGGNIVVTLPGNIVVRSDLDYQSYNGISDDFNTNYALWNASIAKKFLKNNAGEIKITAFDMLGQNQSINQTVTAAYFEEQESLVLQQYFMVSFMYTLRNYGGKSKAGKS